MNRRKLFGFLAAAPIVGVAAVKTAPAALVMPLAVPSPTDINFKMLQAAATERIDDYGQRVWLEWSENAAREHSKRKLN